MVWLKKDGKQMTEKYLALWKFMFVNKVCKLESQGMSSELKLLEKVQNKMAQKTLQPISEI